MSLKPKEFRNDPYSSTRPDTALAGKKPIPVAPGSAPPKLKEYPVKSQPAGWTGSGKVGAGRVITSTDSKGKDTFHGVLGHDEKKGGDKDDHYLATKTKAKKH